MTQRTLPPVPHHLADETGWLEYTAALLRDGRLAEIDPAPLAEYLADMAKRDRREVFSRLVVLLSHLLKWECQPAGRSASWRLTVLEQRSELQGMLDSGTLRNHAVAVYARAYAAARERAVVETEMDPAAFPAVNPWSLDAALADELR